ncbi:MAG: O-antigen ligase family protein [Terracidiphilus sp.]|nr:O-antigen ligase family protein [Terracidiphilus sp.]MDR3776294.1 O-antigen ligase family protein [Terracidiphilus sp.]
MENAARRGAYWLALSLPLTTALVFSSAFLAPFSAPKNAIFVLTACALAALALLFSSERKLEREERWFWIAGAAYVAITVVSAMLSQSRGLCLDSVEFTVCGVLLFAAVRAALGGERRVLNTRNVQSAIAAVAVLVSLVTGAQFFGMQAPGAFGFLSNYTGRMRMYSTLGNPDFVAAFLSVALPVAIGLSLKAQRLRAFWVAASVLIGVAVLLTGSRGGVIALAAGITVIAFTGMRRRVPMLVAVVVVCALAAGTQLNARTPWESLRGRILIWQVSLGGGAARSALGSGPGTFAYEYPVRLGQFFAEPGRQPLLRFASAERHAQNDFVEAWHETGWLGLGSLLALLGAWFAVAIRRLRTAGGEIRTQIAVAIASVSAFSAAALFDFPMHRAETWSMLWLSMAVPLLSPTLPAVPQRRRAWLHHAGAVALLVAGSYAAFAPLAASFETAKGESEEDQGRLESSQRAYRAALRWERWSPDANFDLVRAEAKAGDFSDALAQSKIAIRSANEPELYLLRSRILQNAGRENEARHELEAATRLFPYSKELRDEAASYLLPDTAAEGSWR